MLHSYWYKRLKKVMATLRWHDFTHTISGSVSSVYCANLMGRFGCWKLGKQYSNNFGDISHTTWLCIHTFRENLAIEVYSTILGYIVHTSYMVWWFYYVASARNLIYPWAGKTMTNNDKQKLKSICNNKMFFRE